MEDRLKTILYNAISLLIDETFEQYDNEEEWFEMIQNELGCTKEELEQYGIYITKCRRKAPCFSNGDIRQLLFC